MSIKDNGEFRHFDRMMRKAEKDNGKNSSRPASCQQCIIYQPNFKYRKCFFAECYYKKDVDVFRKKPMSKPLSEKTFLSSLKKDAGRLGLRYDKNIDIGHGKRARGYHGVHVMVRTDDNWRS